MRTPPAQALRVMQASSIVVNRLQPDDEFRVLHFHNMCDKSAIAAFMRVLP